MEWQPSEECTEGAKTRVQKALLGQGPLRQVLSPCSQTEGDKKRQGKGMTQGVLTLKSPSYPQTFLLDVFGRKCILYNIQQKAAPCGFKFYVKLLIEAAIYIVA